MALPAFTSVMEFWGQGSTGMCVDFCWKIRPKNIFFHFTFTDFQKGHHKVGIILENKVFQKFKLSKNVNSKKGHVKYTAIPNREVQEHTGTFYAPHCS